MSDENPFHTPFMPPHGRPAILEGDARRGGRLRTIDERCGNCFYGRFGNDAQGALDVSAIVCKHDPPRAIPIPTPQGLGFATPRPTMRPDDWCGRHEPKLGAAS